MSNKWLNVTAFYGSDLAKKNAFEEICMDILQKHYPGHFIESFRMDNSLSDISIKSSADEKRIVFHTRFYTDELTNSRKQRIRKAFYYCSDMYAKVNVSFIKWILCIPGTITEEDKLWWNNFKTRSSLSSSFELELLDGNTLIELIEKYDIHNDWFNKMVPIKKSVTQQKSAGKKISGFIESVEQTNSFPGNITEKGAKDEIEYMDLFIDEKDVDLGSMFDENIELESKAQDESKKRNPISALFKKLSVSSVTSPFFKSLNKSNSSTNTSVSANMSSPPTNKKKKLLKIIGICLFSVLIISLVLYFIWTPDQEIGKPALKIHERQMMIGNNYARRISPQFAQFYDSAIIAYKCVLLFNPRNGLAAKRLNSVRKAKDVYRAVIEKNIRTDSNKYFISLRKPTEGLRLFKYLYDPSNRTKGKYGYLDDKGKVAILPIFDFNFRKMKEAGETFQEGRAKVCLVISQHDTAYFYINKRGERIYE